MTIHVNIDEAKIRLSELVAAAQRGEEVIIGRSGSPKAKLVPVASELSKAEIAKMRQEAYGNWRGRLPEGVNWKEPMSEDELALWYGPGPLPGDIDESAR